MPRSSTITRTKLGRRDVQIFPESRSGSRTAHGSQVDVMLATHTTEEEITFIDQSGWRLKTKERKEKYIRSKVQLIRAHSDILSIVVCCTHV